MNKSCSDPYEVEAVADGEAALATSRARSFDTVISDVMMPVLDGVELLRALRAAALAQAEVALRAAQKMDAIGKLTGGVAHDFNNLPQVIGGNLQLLAKDVAGSESAENRLQNALAGVSCGAKLASQLLSFGRRQRLAPKVVNLGRFVRGLDDIWLHRTLGEQIHYRKRTGRIMMIMLRAYRRNSYLMIKTTFKIFVAVKDQNVDGKVASIYIFLAVIHIALWGLALAAFQNYPVLLGTCFLAYSFGVRHALDADHIAAIDNVTRKLMLQGKHPVGVGFFFSLGHSTIVFGLSAAVAVTAAAIKVRFNFIENVGNIAGTLLSALFLFVVAVMNMTVLLAICRTFRSVKSGGLYEDEDLNLLLAKRGFFGRVFRGLFRLVNHSWEMYPIGLLFGLGFDTATEIGLLGISAAEGSKELPIWSIMMFPALFTAGMALIDTTDSILMLGAYGWAFVKPVRKLYYNITITSISVLVALIVGGLETLGLMQGEFNLSGTFWNSIASLNNNFGDLGYLIVGVLIGSWIISVILYKLNRYDDIEVRAAE